jgi:glucose/arabinose dehydrogenase
MSILRDSQLDAPDLLVRYRGLLILGFLLIVLWLISPVIRYIPEFPPDPLVISTEEGPIRVVTITEQLNRPWGLAFLPNGDMLITELAGNLRLIHNGKLQPQTIGGLPKVETRDQAGLMDIALHPRFAENRLVYLTYSKIGARGNTPALACARFDGSTLVGFHDVFVSEAWSSQSGGNTSSRVVFGLDGTLYMTVGDLSFAKMYPIQSVDSSIR